MARRFVPPPPPSPRRSPSRIARLEPLHDVAPGRPPWSDAEFAVLKEVCSNPRGRRSFNSVRVEVNRRTGKTFTKADVCAAVKYLKGIPGTNWAPGW